MADTAGVSAPEPLIRTDGLTKRFGGVTAVGRASVSIMAGEMHGLVGQNGAGKSTLGKLIGGVLTPDEGSLLVDGRRARFRSPRDALALGITMIAQEMTLVPAQSVLDNVFLGVAPRRAGVLAVREMRRRYRELLDRAGFDVPAGARVRDLTVADQQKVEILRALACDARVIVMDEPTATLTRDEAERLFAVIGRLRESGTTIVYVTHFLEEVLELSDRVTVMRDGEVVQTTQSADETPERLVAAMVGREVTLDFPAKRPPPADAEPVLSVRGLTVPPIVHDVSFSVASGEIVGLAGLVGAGRTEIGRGLFGALKRSAGEIYLEGERIRPKRPSDAIRAGIVYLPESRKLDGLVFARSILENITLPHVGRMSRGGVVSGRRERSVAAKVLEQLDVRGARLGDRASNLSGGNQQKLMFAKWLLRRPKILIADEPTRGVDVGAKRAIYELIGDLARSGMAVLLISSEMEEVLGLSHRIVVIRAGEAVTTFAGDEIEEQDVVEAAFGMTGSRRAA